MALVACGRPSESDATTGWSGSVRDSAGVAIVSNPDTGIWTGETRWVADADLTIGEEGVAEYQFGRIADLDVGPYGRVHVLDDQSARVSVYDTLGRFVRAFGRMGSGPGEFSIDAFSIRVDEHGTVFVRDGIHRRDNAFDSTGTFLRSVPLPGPFKEWELLSQGGFVTRSTARTWDGLVHVTSSGVVVDTTMVFNYDIARTRGALSSAPTQRTAGVIQIPLLPPAPAWTATPNGRIAAGISNQYRIEIRHPDGTLEVIIEKRQPKRQLSSDDQDAVIDRIKDLMRASGSSENAIAQVFERFVYLPPDSLPAFTRITHGPHATIWVQGLLPIDSMGANATLDALIPNGRGWDVFCSAGRYLGEVTLPPHFTPKATRDEYLYGVEMDEFDVQRVVRFRLRSPTGGSVTVPVC